MNSYETTERLPYTAQQMFDLVSNVAEYSQFMPLCERSQVISTRTLDDGREEMNAVLEVLHAKTGLGGVFESLVHLDRGKLTISASSKTGPVRHLANHWEFRERGETECDAVFSIEYEMRHWPLQVVMNRVYKRVFEKLSGAFRLRAAEVYGKAVSKPEQMSRVAGEPVPTR